LSLKTRFIFRLILKKSNQPAIFNKYLNKSYTEFFNFNLNAKRIFVQLMVSDPNSNYDLICLFFNWIDY